MLGRMLNVHYIPSNRLSNLLKHWAGTDLQEAKARIPEDHAKKKIKVRSLVTVVGRHIGAQLILLRARLHLHDGSILFHVKRCNIGSIPY